MLTITSTWVSCRILIFQPLCHCNWHKSWDHSRQLELQCIDLLLVLTSASGSFFSIMMMEFFNIALLCNSGTGLQPCKNWVVRYWRGRLSGQDADLYMVRLIPLPLTVCCSNKCRLVLPFWYYQSTKEKGIQWSVDHTEELNCWNMLWK